ncbi:MAG TPA: FimV/HubP family polar landmark protein, partial [Halioglobus sp.]
MGCLHAGSSWALGLGEIKLESFLNEPLKASVDLLNMGSVHEDQVRIRLASSDDFDKQGVDRAYFLTNLQFDVVADGSGGARIVITSEEPVLEPYLDFIIEARWPSGRLLREYTVLVDPPVFSQATPVVSASQRVEEEEGIAAPAKKNEGASRESTKNVNDPNMGAWGSEGGGGTRVTVGDSNLAPGAMPQRSYNATTAARPTPGSRYMISRDQTLWQIASQAKPAGVSVHQTMLDIQRLNPDAFINGNINRIKAGYIIYLPSADDISSADVPTALAEVRQQNEAWREGRDDEIHASSRPSLRISAEPELEETAANTGGASTSETAKPSADTGQQPGSSVITAAGDKPSPVVSGDTEDQVSDLEQQLENMQRIVTLKDDQIAALQKALAETGGKTDIGTAVEPAPGVAPATVEPAPEAPTGETVTAEEQSPVEEAPSTESAPAAEPEVTAAVEQNIPETAAPVIQPTDEPAAEPESATVESWTSYLVYIIGAIALAIAGFVFASRRKDKEDDIPLARQVTTREDVFSDVRLQDQKLDLDASGEEADDYDASPSSRSSRGYGERKHDEYASDVDATDALAEADIYIAYGRHPQAIDLLNNALANEPNNPVYRLKLLEIYAELNNRAAATAQLKKIQDIGDPASITRAESLIAGLRGDSEPEQPKPGVRTRPGNGGPGLAPNPLAMMPESDELEADFSGLEIENSSGPGQGEDDLDLSADFGTGRTQGYDDEELV